MTARQKIAAQDIAALQGELGDTGEVLSLNERTRVLRLRLPSGARVIVKRALGAHAVRRLRQELAMLQRVAAVEGVSRIASHVVGTADSLVLRDEGGVVLAQVLRQKQLDTREVLHIALQLARILSAVHAQGVVHRDINPGNIVLVGEGPRRRPVLIDFNIASSFAEEAPGFTHQSEIPGTLLYMAPEQTGRTGRTVDQRADLYSLGATLYEMVSGRTPFEGNDPLQLIHDHLVRVPTPPKALRPALPQALSDIVMRLLEKESDHRYQSAEGLARDLARLIEHVEQGDDAKFALGEHDFAARLSAPSRLVGRDSEIATLRAAFEAALSGELRAVIVAGAPGVGKTALINELRPLVTGQRGWFVAGKFDQCRRDVASSAVLQAMRTLGRLLLSQSDLELLSLRAELLRVLGPNAGLMASVLPEFGVLLGVAPEPATGDPLLAEARLYQAGVVLMRAIASPARPVVMVIDDLQWAGPGSIKFFNALQADTSFSGLLLVGAYRDGEVDAAHPLTPMLARWAQQDTAPLNLALRNLPPADLSVLLQEMLRLPSERAQSLAHAVGARTGGNPFDTVELINALRQDGALKLTEQGWGWDAAEIRRYVGRGEVVDLLSRRMDRLPGATQALLETMACLSGQAELALLRAATGLSAEELDGLAEPALEDGLLLMEHGAGSPTGMRFRHDRVQQAAYQRLDEPSRRRQHLVLARRLAALPAWASVSAEQYLLVTADVREPQECRAVASLFEATALQTIQINYALAERFLSAAISLLVRVETDADQATLLTLRTHHVGTLYCLGRHDEIDAVYREIEARCSDPMLVYEAAGLRLTSLTSRGRQSEAVTLGMNLLRELMPLGDEAMQSEDDAWRDIVAWAQALDVEADLQRPAVTDARVLAATTLLHRISPAAYFCGPRVLLRTLHYSLRLWATYGPCTGLMSAPSQTSAVAVPLYSDYRIGYVVARHVLGVAEARGDEPYTSQIRSTLSTFAQHWFEPLEHSLRSMQQAREGLLAGGSLMTASFTYTTSLALQLDCAPSLDALQSELETAESLGHRAGNTNGLATFVAFRQLLGALRGETEATGSFCDARFDETAHLSGPAVHAVPGSAYRVNRAIGAAIFGDLACLIEHADAAVLLAAPQSNYRAVPAQLLRALGLAQQLQRGLSGDPATAAAELDECQSWLSARAKDAPANCLHLAKWIAAERAWAQGEMWEATQRFAQALSEVGRVRRPWHHALMTERCALFHLTHGPEPYGQQLMGEALRRYETWGASGKVTQLLQAYPHLRQAQAAQSSPGVSVRTTGISSDQIDMVAILGASQALSSETHLDRLLERVHELLGKLTGATRVLMLLRGDDDQWTLPGAGQGGESRSVEAAAERGELPLTALRYVQRVREPLVVEDAVHDDRFTGDHYFAGLERCSLLGVPILNQGELRAVLMLENRQSRGAFSGDRLDAVNLIAGQLAVSLDNAMLYASLERKVAERTEALEQANQRLATLAITDSLTGLANRRRFNEVLDTEWKRAMRPGNHIGLVMIDIDQFKLYNDHYGHLGGDECLKKVASCLKEGLRMVADLAARYGGEEFVLVLPNTDLAGTYSAAERLRAQVAALAEPHQTSIHGVVTISMGITAFVPSDDITPAQMLEVADAALYEAKHHGRNQVWGQG